MGKKLTQKEIQERVLEVSAGELEYTPEIDEIYTTKDKLSTFTHKCGFKFKRSVGNVLYSNVVLCPKCSPNSFPRTENILIDALGVFNILLIENFEGCGDRHKVKVQFPCGCQSIRQVGHLILGTSICLECDLKKKANLTKEQVQDRLLSFKYGAFTLLSEYIDIHSDITYQCNKCFYVNTGSLANLQSLGGKCKNCFGSVESIKEEYLAILLDDFNMDFVRQFKIENYRYDFYLPKYNVLLEYDGIQHISKKHRGGQIECNDLVKYELAIANNYKLVRINHIESIARVIINILLLFNDYPFGEYTQVSGNAKHLSDEMKI